MAQVDVGIDGMEASTKEGDLMRQDNKALSKALNSLKDELDELRGEWFWDRLLLFSPSCAE